MSRRPRCAASPVCRRRPGRGVDERQVRLPLVSRRAVLAGAPGSSFTSAASFAAAAATTLLPRFSEGGTRGCARAPTLRCVAGVFAGGPGRPGVDERLVRLPPLMRRAVLAGAPGASRATLSGVRPRVLTTELGPTLGASPEGARAVRRSAVPLSRFERAVLIGAPAARLVGLAAAGSGALAEEVRRVPPSSTAQRSSVPAGPESAAAWDVDCETLPGVIGRLAGLPGNGLICRRDTPGGRSLV